MKIGRVSTPNGETVAVEAGGPWLDLSRANQAYRLHVDGVAEEPCRCIRTLIEAGLMTPGFIAEVVAFLEQHALLDDYTLPEPAKFLLPLRPGKIVALGRNYAAHAAETGAETPEEPIIFSKSPSACIGDGEPIIVRESYGRVDHEGELAVVIGRTAKYVAEDEAYDYIAGYTIMNDVTARGMQSADISRGLPWFRCKSIDTFGPLGPVIALPDVVPWPVKVDIELRVNGKVRQQSNTDKFLFSIPETLSFITRYMTLEPGDVVSTGTPEGIGALAPGDTVAVSVPQIGVLTNPVAPAR